MRLWFTCKWSLGIPHYRTLYQTHKSLHSRATSFKPKHVFKKGGWQSIISRHCIWQRTTGCAEPNSGEHLWLGCFNNGKTDVMILREASLSARLCTKNFLLGMTISSLFRMAHLISRTQNPEQACRYQGPRGPLGTPGWGSRFPFPLQAARQGQAAPGKAV